MPIGSPAFIHHLELPRGLPFSYNHLLASLYGVWIEAGINLPRSGECHYILGDDSRSTQSQIEVTSFLRLPIVFSIIRRIWLLAFWRHEWGLLSGATQWMRLPSCARDALASAIQIQQRRIHAFKDALCAMCKFKRHFGKHFELRDADRLKGAAMAGQAIEERRKYL